GTELTGTGVVAPRADVWPTLSRPVRSPISDLCGSYACYRVIAPVDRRTCADVIVGGLEIKPADTTMKSARQRVDTGEPASGIHQWAHELGDAALSHPKMRGFVAAYDGFV